MANLSALLILLVGSCLVVSFDQLHLNDEFRWLADFDKFQEESDVKAPIFCFLEAKLGPCKAGIPMYFYDSASGTCKKFIYGGCCGNSNRFTEMQLCEKICVKMSATEEEIEAHLQRTKDKSGGMCAVPHN